MACIASNASRIRSPFFRASCIEIPWMSSLMVSLVVSVQGGGGGGAPTPTGGWGGRGGVGAPWGAAGGWESVRP